MTLSLNGACERVVAPDYAIVQCVSAMWTYRYHNGYTVAIRGPFTAHVIVIPNATQNGPPVQSTPHSTFMLTSSSTPSSQCSNTVANRKRCGRTALTPIAATATAAFTGGSNR
ncbi:hypothetical protein BJV78DRAFT_1215862 [Lactifluus subvellereus]|nr:hypothetical protein BJV78DRAFT_1215862 [Lactifluus subvellereus]